MEQEIGNIENIERAYEVVKEYIVYEALNGLVIAIVVFLLISRAWEEYNKHLAATDEVLNMTAIWGQLKGYVLMILLIGAMPLIFNTVEGILADMSDKLVTGFGGDSSSKATDTMISIVNEANNALSEKYAEASGFDYLPLIFESVINIFSNSIANLFAPISIFVFKYVYTFFIIARYTWLLMLEVTAPIAIVCLLHSDTKQYFYAWLKNMFLCYLLIPLFLLADLFSNAVTVAMLSNSDGSASTTTSCIAILLVVIVKVKIFATVSSKITQLI